MPAERRLGDGLEDRSFRTCRRRTLLPDLRQNRGRPRLLRAHRGRVAHGPPDAPALVLAVDEPAPGARRHDPDAGALQPAVADVAGRLSRIERQDPGVGEGGCRHRFVLPCSCSGEQEAVTDLPGAAG